MRLQTSRLDLLPCSVEVGQAILRNRADVEALLAAHVLDDWPSEDLLELLSTYVKQLESDPSLLGWGSWLMVERAHRTIVGDLGFKGPPDREGTVEIGYSVVPTSRGQGYAFEGVQALVNWASAQHDVRAISADCEAENVPSIRILQKLGFRQLETDGSLLRWELRKPTELGQ